MADIQSDFLGQGWAFPVRADDGVVTLARAEVDIKESIGIILGTSVGERLMRATFGSRLQELVFAANNGSTLALAANYSREALDKWEPRIDVDEVVVTIAGADGNIMYLNISYTIRTSNTPDNLVYPFFLQN